MKEQVVVDAKSSGLTMCPKCKTYSINENGYCYNGCQCKHVNKKVIGEANLHLGLPVLIRECQDCGAIHLGNGIFWYKSWDNKAHWGI